MTDFSDRARAFLAAPKVGQGQIRWRNKPHPDYSEARIAVATTESPPVRGQVVLLAHKFREPRKYDFSVILDGICVFRLDVEPGTTHFDLTNLEIFRGTHWHNLVDGKDWPDSRTLPHRAWLDEFLTQANIEHRGNYHEPPFEGMQPGLGL